MLYGVGTFTYHHWWFTAVAPSLKRKKRNYGKRPVNGHSSNHKIEYRRPEHIALGPALLQMHLFIEKRNRENPP
ncbi:hypothetical protein CDAR_381661 [Caerostris darwini]|uniref:Uncharacterized protein n=1 Tax=Caerostris darwini TaxID=1538125 RepID=A0AAV4V537_9ARAC|nr:hypothetical protein CDAR_381661 [Caerostris darwini]